VDDETNMGESMYRAVKAALAIAVVGVALGVAGPASAASAGSTAPAASSGHAVHPDGWKGPCYPAKFDEYNSGGGWCDGNGPDWVYHGWVICSNGNIQLFGPTKWDGDRSGSYRNCNGRGHVTSAGVDTWHVGS
jgi:hypothetical protein